MKKLFVLTMLAAMALHADAQLKPYEWVAVPAIHAIKDTAMQKERAVVLSRKVTIEYAYNAKGELENKKTLYKLVHLNNESALNSYNKVKLYYQDGYGISSIKARTILPNGKVVELRPEAVKDMKDEEGYKMKLFAFEGIEPGCEIEYTYQVTYPSKYFFTEYLQDEDPVVYASFTLLAPQNLVYEVKGYNDVAVAKDTILDDKLVITAVSRNLPVLEEEMYASPVKHFPRVECKLSYNKTGNNKSRLLTWNDAAKNVYANNYEFTDKEKKAVSVILNNKDFRKLSDNRSRAIWLENYIKANYFVKKDLENEDAGQIDFVLKNKISTESGVRRLFAACFMTAGIPFELGFTANRSAKPFDYEFENWDNLDNALFYFPESDEYMAPAEYAYRMPLFPYNWGEQEGMFCKTVTIGEYTTAMAENRTIPLAPDSVSYHNHYIDIALNKDLDTAVISMNMTFLGYPATGLVPGFIFLEEDKKMELAKQLLRIMDKEERTDKVVWKNADLSGIANGVPFSLTGSIYSNGSVEKAGNKYLFKIGEMIGRQSEMYEDKERKFDAETEYPHQLVREIKFRIPEGYKVENPEDIKIRKVAYSNGEETCSFVSDYELKGNLLIIHIKEVYRKILYPKSQFEDFRAVINAAADFNKVTLTLSRKD